MCARCEGGIIGAVVVLVGIALILGPGLWELAEPTRAPNAANASVPTNAPRSLRTCTTCAADARAGAATRRRPARSCGWPACRSASCAAGCREASGPNDATDGSLGARFDELAAEVETEHGVPGGGGAALRLPGRGIQPLLLAAREAIVNAVRHSGAPSVSVYLEVEAQRVSIFVRDRGRGPIRTPFAA